jgi:hypothetical protein
MPESTQSDLASPKDLCARIAAVCKTISDSLKNLETQTRDSNLRNLQASIFLARVAVEELARHARHEEDHQVVKTLWS